MTCDACGKAFDPDEDESCSTGEVDECGACSDAYRAEAERAFGWMIPHIRDANRAEREGDYELTRSITESCGVKYTGREA